MENLRKFKKPTRIEGAQPVGLAYNYSNDLYGTLVDLLF